MKRIVDNTEGIEERFVSTIRWKTTLLTAHVETVSGPSLHMLRASIDDGSTYEVEAKGEIETNHAGSMVFIAGDELVFALDTPIEHEADASLVVPFETDEETLMEFHSFGESGDPPNVGRSLTDDSIFALGSDMESVSLTRGSWTIQATAIPDGRERVSIIRFKPARSGEVRTLRQSA